uniref:Uncharacterized protein n=1 Tax=Sipha flava TaxID=143950 RepID=A0A2S2R2X8_9HEMI
MSVVKGTGVYRIACSMSESPWTCRFYIIFFCCNFSLAIFAIASSWCPRITSFYTCTVRIYKPCRCLSNFNETELFSNNSDKKKNSDLRNIRGFVTGTGGRPKPRFNHLSFLTYYNV